VKETFPLFGSTTYVPWPGTTSVRPSSETFAPSGCPVAGKTTVVGSSGVAVLPPRSLPSTSISVGAPWSSVTSSSVAVGVTGVTVALSEPRLVVPPWSLIA